MQIRALGNNVMFKFLDHTAGEKGSFTDSSIAGLIIPMSKNSQKAHRWGQVVAAGPRATAVKPDDYILIEGLMWMEGVKIGDDKVWKTDETKILAIAKDRSACQSQAF